MPNGYSGGFHIAKEELLTILRSLDRDTVVGKFFLGSRKGNRLTALEAVGLIESLAREMVGVEEEDRRVYTVFLVDPQVTKVVTELDKLEKSFLVKPSSKFHTALRNYHEESIKRGEP